MGDIGVEACIARAIDERVVPGNINVVPGAVKLHHVPGVVHGIAGDVHGRNARAGQQELIGKRITLADGLALDEGAVGRARGGDRDVAVRHVAVVGAVAHKVVVQGLSNLEGGHVIQAHPGHGLGDLGLEALLIRRKTVGVHKVGKRHADCLVSGVGRTVSVRVVVTHTKRRSNPVVLGIHNGATNGLLQVPEGICGGGVKLD